MALALRPEGRPHAHLMLRTTSSPDGLIGCDPQESPERHLERRDLAADEQIEVGAPVQDGRRERVQERAVGGDRQLGQGIGRLEVDAHLLGRPPARAGRRSGRRGRRRGSRAAGGARRAARARLASWLSTVVAMRTRMPRSISLGIAWSDLREVPRGRGTRRFARVVRVERELEGRVEPAEGLEPAQEPVGEERRVRERQRRQDRGSTLDERVGEPRKHEHLAAGEPDAAEAERLRLPTARANASRVSVRRSAIRGDDSVRQYAQARLQW